MASKATTAANEAFVSKTEEYIIAATELSDAGKIDEAIAELDKGLKLDPNDGLLHAEKGVILMLADRPQEAVVPLEKAASIAGAEASVHYNLGRVYEALDRIGEAQGAYEAAVKCAPQVARYRTNLAALLLRQAKWQAGYTMASSALELEQHDFMAVYYKSVACDGLGKASERNELEDSLLVPDRFSVPALRSMEMVAMARTVRADWYGAYKAWACFLAANDHPDQIEDLRIDIPSQTLFNALFCFTQAGHAEDYIPYMRDWLRLHARDQDKATLMRVRFMLGQTLLGVGDYDDAATELQAVVDWDEAFENALIKLGAAYGASGKLKEAVATLQRGVKLLPKDPDGHYNLALALMESGAKRSEWEPLFLHSLELRFAPLVLLHYVRGCVRDKLVDAGWATSLAQHWVQEGLKRTIVRSAYDTLTSLTSALNHNSKGGAALAMLKQFAESELPNDYRVVRLYGSQLVHMEKNKQAVTVMTAAVAKFPDEHSIKVILAQASAALKDTKRAKELMEEALRQATARKDKEAIATIYEGLETWAIGKKGSSRRRSKSSRSPSGKRS